MLKEILKGKRLKVARLEDSGDPNGKFGVYIQYEDGDTEYDWRDKKSDRDKVYNHTKNADGIKSIKKVER